MQINFNLSRATIIATVVVVVVNFGAASAGSEYYASSSETINEQWKASMHLVENNADYKQLAYLADPEAPVPARLKLDDEACLRSGCHAKDKFQDKEIKFTEKVTFKHKVHFEKPVEGLTLHCDSCHFKQSRKKHFEVTKETCFLCHFKTTKIKDGKNFNSKPKLNEGRSKCDLCHTVPTKSLQSQLSADDLKKKPITHQTIEKAKVPCQGCHFPLVEGVGEVTKEDCLDCHNRWLAKRGEKTLMHEKHVATQRATCFDCHQTIRHMAKGKSLVLDDVRTSCVLCHEDQHRYQKILLAGTPVSENITPVAGLMDGVATNCIGCHVKEKHADGQTVMTGSAEACVACHTPGHRKMLDDWKKTLKSEVRIVAEVEVEAREALKAAEGKLDEAKLKEAREMIAAGRELLNIVRVGNGVHNKKYAIMILDEAIANFEDTIDLLAEGG